MFLQIIFFKICATKLWVSRASVKMNHWTSSIFQLSLSESGIKSTFSISVDINYGVRLLAIKLRIKTVANTWLFTVPLPVGLSQAHYIPVSHRKTAPRGRYWLLLSSCGSLGTRRTGLLFEVGLRPARKNTTQLRPMVISKNIVIEKWSTREIRVRISFLYYSELIRMCYFFYKGIDYCPWHSLVWFSYNIGYSLPLKTGIRLILQIKIPSKAWRYSSIAGLLRIVFMIHLPQIGLLQKTTPCFFFSPLQKHPYHLHAISQKYQVIEGGRVITKPKKRGSA